MRTQACLRDTPAIVVAMKVAAFQFDVRLDEPSTNLATVEAGLREAASAGVKLVVLPEMWPTSFVSGQGDALREPIEASERAVARVVELSGELGLVVCGTAFATPPTAGPPLNRLHICDRGTPLAHYDKVHLFSPTAEHETFRAGALAPSTVSIGETSVAGIICYDLRFGDITRMAARGGAEILVCPAQWPSPRGAHWRALAIGRAVENQGFVIACNRSGRSLIGKQKQSLEFPGNSIIVDPHGTVLAEGHGEAGLIVAELDLDVARELRGKIPIAADRKPDLYAQWNGDAS